jgi:hypothetical protein
LNSPNQSKENISIHGKTKVAIWNQIASNTQLKNSIPSCEKKEKRIFDAEKEYPAEKSNLYQKIEIFHTKVVTSVAEVQTSVKRPGVREFYILFIHRERESGTEASDWWVDWRSEVCGEAGNGAGSGAGVLVVRRLAGGRRLWILTVAGGRRDREGCLEEWRSNTRSLTVSDADDWRWRVCLRLSLMVML